MTAPKRLEAPPLFYLFYYYLGMVVAFIPGSTLHSQCTPGWIGCPKLIFQQKKTESPKQQEFNISLT
jgi:hypothetical protein